MANDHVAGQGSGLKKDHHSSQFLAPIIPTEPLKSLEKKGKTLEKTRNFLQGKEQGIQKKNKKRKDKEGQGRDNGCKSSPCPVLRMNERCWWTEGVGAWRFFLSKKFVHPSACFLLPCCSRNDYRINSFRARNLYLYWKLPSQRE